MIDCPNCDNSGYIPEQVGDNEWEPYQCEFCYTVPDSIFNTVKELQSTITDQSAEILRLRELLKEVKTDSTYWYKKYFLIPGSHENITMVIDAVASRHLGLIEKFKQEGIE